MRKTIFAAVLLGMLAGSVGGASEGDITYCPNCKKYWQAPEGGVVESCCVIHQPGDCCHYGYSEIKIEPKQPSGCAIGEHDWKDSQYVIAYCPLMEYANRPMFGMIANIAVAVPVQSCSRCGVLRVKKED